jgi:hypothetical protein
VGPQSGIPIIGGGSVFGLAEPGPTYISLFHGSDSTESNVQYPVPAAGTATQLRARVVNAPGGSRSWTFTLRKNGAATAVSCAITGAATTCTSANSVAFAAGDLISMHVLLSGAGNPPGTDGMWTAQFNP